MTQAEKAAQFSALHVRGEPLVLYNIWDAGSAKAVAGSGAKAVATGSWSMAAAQGYPDGEAIPLDTVELVVRQISRSVDVPVTVDLEGAYAVEPEQVAANVARIVMAVLPSCSGCTSGTVRSRAASAWPATPSSSCRGSW